MSRNRSVTVYVLAMSDGEHRHLSFPLGHFSNDLVGYGITKKESLQDLQTKLAWAGRNRDEVQELELSDLRIYQQNVPVIPAYPDGDNIQPCGEAVQVPVVAVRGKHASGVEVCILPVLRSSFFYSTDTQFRELVNHYVRQKTFGKTPLELARLVHPVTAELEELQVKWQEKRDPEDLGFGEELEVLGVVAEAMTESRFSKRFFRPWLRMGEQQCLSAYLSAGTGAILLVGETGTGKTTVILDVAKSMEALWQRAGEDAENRKPRRRFWHTSGQRLIAGMSFLGQWEERCEKVIRALGKIGGVLVVNNLLGLLRVGGQGPEDSVGAFLRGWLERGELRIIAECTPSELEACRRLLPGLVDLFSVIHVDEFTRDRGEQALRQLADHLAQAHEVQFESSAIRRVVDLHARFVPYGAFPGRSARFLAGLADRFQREKQKVVGGDDVVREFTRQSGIGEDLLRDDKPLEKELVLDFLRSKVIGQPAAVSAMASVILTWKAGMNDPGRPIRTMLLCGPTGVGKTELAKSVAAYLFGSGEEKQRLVRLDMSEYAGYGAARRLVLSGDGGAGPLVDYARRQPFLVLLLDEVEKASPEVFDMLLGLFDEGRITDPYGRTTWFRSAIVVMTSNLGVRSSMRPLGFTDVGLPDYRKAASGFFRPEFLNRIDDLVGFQPLGRESILSIARKELEQLAEREGIARRGLKLTWDDEVVNLVADAGFDEKYGARPLQRALETLVIVPLARYLLEHTRIPKQLRLVRTGSGTLEIKADRA